MLKIRKEQFDEFRRGRVDRFEHRLGIILCSASDPLAHVPEDRVRDLVRACLDYARSLDIILPDEIIPFFGYLSRYGPDFGREATSAWAAPILENGRLSGSEKIEMLDQILREHSEGTI